MNPHPIISSYLVKPRLVNPDARWAGFRTAKLEVRRQNSLSYPAIFRRSLVALLLWALGVGSLQYLAAPHQLPGQSVVASIEGSSPAASPPAQLARAGSHAVTLAIGPTGQMLPGIPAAPTGSIPNRYGAGQCTQYVAGRRQVPGNWGNANTWYSRAAAAGWSVGSVPAVGAIAWTSAGPLGHVALVEDISTDYESIKISEMNVTGLGQISSRWVPVTSFRYIYAPGY